MQVHNELGHGFSESVYHRSLMVAFGQAGLQAASEVRIAVKFRGCDVGHFVADLVVEDKVVIELKAVARLASDHSAQVINYLKASGMLVALLVNFGAPRMQHKRLEHPSRYHVHDQQEHPFAS
jgi:GxxExxY protein